MVLIYSSLGRVTFTHTEAQSSGGGVYIDKQCHSLLLSQITIDDSHAINGDGGSMAFNTENYGITLDRVSINNTSSDYGNGGSIYIYLNNQI